MCLNHLLFAFHHLCHFVCIFHYSSFFAGAVKLFCWRFHSKLTSLGTAEFWEDGFNVALNMKNYILQNRASCCNILVLACNLHTIQGGGEGNVSYCSLFIWCLKKPRVDV